VAEPIGTDFGGLLRRLRTDAGFTQEELAEEARLSARSISDLERGINQTARKDTARLLADALGLDGTTRAAFEAAARGQAPAPERLPGRSAAAATRTLPRDIASFTGRERELARLLGAVTDAAAGGGVVVGIYAIGGMAGVGKTTFAVHAAHRLAERFPDGQFFLPLHAHTPGQQPVDPENALASLLLTAGVAAEQIPPGLEARMSAWRDYHADKRLLLLLDDAAGHDQVRPLLPSNPGSLVLITSRRHLTALEDATSVGLDTLPDDEATALLTRLAARPDLDPGDAAVAEIIRLCGRLPLAVGMLARQLQHHPTWSAADLAADLAAAWDRLELMQAENLSVAAAFDLSYADLAAGQQLLFRRLGLHPGPSVDARAAAALAGISLAEAGHGLAGLYDNHLLSEPDRGRFQLHDLLREHARALAAADPKADSAAAVDRLLDYYARAADVAGRFFASHPDRLPGPVAQPADVPELSTRDQAGRWLEAERTNLHASIQYASVGGRPGRVVSLAAAISDFLFLAGHWDQAHAVSRTALDAARLTGDQPAVAAALIRLGHSFYMLDEYQAAVETQAEAVGLYTELGDWPGLADALTELGDAQRLADHDRSVAIGTLTEALNLYRELSDRLGEARVLTYIGGTRTVTSDYPAAEKTITRALEAYRDLGDRLGLGHARVYLSCVYTPTGQYAAAAAHAQQALALYQEIGDRHGEANVYTILGDVQHRTGDDAAAATYLSQALAIYRDEGIPLGEAEALTVLGSVQHTAGDAAAAAGTLDRALGIYRETSDRGGQADVLNHLGALELDVAGPTEATTRYAEALRLAQAVHSQLEEARALEGLGRCLIQSGDDQAGTARLQQALEIYQRIGVPGAQRVEATLRDREPGRS
jgi:tetratricopeptide (TPR) repeat protein/transcriptional regulator with XRE-family HTH domain